MLDDYEIIRPNTNTSTSSLLGGKIRPSDTGSTNEVEVDGPETASSIAMALQLPSIMSNHVTNV